MQHLTVDDFSPHLNDRFIVRHGAARLEFSLAEATPSKNAQPNRRASFSLVFLGPAAPILPQAIYAFEHAAFATLELFIVPLGPDGDHMRYEAVFT